MGRQQPAAEEGHEEDAREHHRTASLRRRTGFGRALAATGVPARVVDTLPGTGHRLEQPACSPDAARALTEALVQDAFAILWFQILKKSKPNQYGILRVIEGKKVWIMALGSVRDVFTTSS